MCVARPGDRRGKEGGVKESEGGGARFIEFSKYPCTRQCRTRRLHFSTVSIYLALSVCTLPPALVTPASTLNLTPFPACVAVFPLFPLERWFYSIMIPDFSISRIPGRYFPRMRKRKQRIEFNGGKKIIETKTKNTIE